MIFYHTYPIVSEDADDEDDKKEKKNEPEKRLPREYLDDCLKRDSEPEEVDYHGYWSESISASSTGMTRLVSRKVKRVLYVVPDKELLVS